MADTTERANSVFITGLKNAHALERPLQETLREEEAIASWIDSRLPDVTHTYLERYVADEKAGL